MRFLLFAATFIAAALNAVQAIDDAVLKQATCFTIKGPQSVKSPPTHLNTVTVKATKTITTEVTTSTKTVTTTDTVVLTASTHTDTVSDVRTVTATITAHSNPPVSTKTTTKTSTVTVSSTSTTTVATTSGFRPVESTLTKTNTRKKRDTYWDRVHARDKLSDLAKRAQSFPVYIQSIDCEIYTTTTSTLYATHSVVATITAADSTVTKTTTKTVTKSQTTSPVTTRTVTSTKKATTTSTDIAPASVTTKTVTKTTTTTDIIPGPTLYAACTGSNIHSSKALGEEYYAIEIDSGSYQANSYSFSTAYDCCVACITKFNCTAGIFDPNNANLCSFNFFTDTCGPQASAQETADYFNDNPVSSVFNGLCGELTTRNYAGD